MMQAMFPSWQAVVGVRAQLHAGGWRLLPLCERTKAPLFAGWPEYRYGPEDPEPVIPRTLTAEGAPTRAEHRGTGVITTGIVAVDFDIADAGRAQAARSAFEQVAEAAPLVRYRSNSPRKLLIYGAGAGVEGLTASHGAGDAKIEVFANHPGRQVMIHGRHPSGAVLEYEGDGPEDWPVADLPKLDRNLLRQAFQSALDAAGIEANAAVATAGAGVRRQANPDEATRALAEQFRRILTGESVHRASNAAADLLAFQLDLSAEQGARILAALAMAAEVVNPGEAERYREMQAKAHNRASWYARHAETPPQDPDKRKFWLVARVRRFGREWSSLPVDVQRKFLDAARRATR